jgi:hypothetical protein
MCDYTACAHTGRRSNDKIMVTYRLIGWFKANAINLGLTPYSGKTQNLVPSAVNCLSFRLRVPEFVICPVARFPCLETSRGTVLSAKGVIQEFETVISTFCVKIRGFYRSVDFWLLYFFQRLTGRKYASTPVRVTIPLLLFRLTLILVALTKIYRPNCSLHSLFWRNKRRLVISPCILPNAGKPEKWSLKRLVCIQPIVARFLACFPYFEEIQI